MTPPLERKSRPCAGPGCSKKLGSSYRSHAKYCSVGCRVKALRDRADGACNALGQGTPNERAQAPAAPRAASEAQPEPFVVPRMTAEEAERRRPEFHAWVYGAAKNPIHKVRPIR